MNKLTLNANKRDLVGRKVKRLRKSGFLPANVYGNKVKSLSIQVQDSDFQKVYKQAGETGLIELVIGSDKRPVLIHHVQVDPINNYPMHADFLQVNLKEKVTAQVPVELIGESPAEKQSLGTVVKYIDEIEVEALPSDLPDKFEIDAASLTEVEQTILVKDLPYDKSKVEVKEDVEQIVVKVEPPRKEEVEAPTAEEGVEGEAVPEGEAETEKTSEGEDNTPEE